MDANRLIQPLLQTWQALASQGPWLQDGFLLLVCVTAVLILLMTGTVAGLFLQALWGIFTHSQPPSETETGNSP